MEEYDEGNPELGGGALGGEARLGRRVAGRHEERAEHLAERAVRRPPALLGEPPVDVASREDEAEQAVATAGEGHADGLERRRSSRSSRRCRGRARRAESSQNSTRGSDDGFAGRAGRSSGSPGTGYRSRSRPVVGSGTVTGGGIAPRRRRTPPGRCATSCSRRAGVACGRGRPSRRRTPRGSAGPRARCDRSARRSPPPSNTSPSFSPTRFAYATVAWLSPARVATISRRVPTTPTRKGGGGEVAHELGPRVAAPSHRPVRRPEVLADLERDGAEVELEESGRRRGLPWTASESPATPRAKVRDS